MAFQGPSFRISELLDSSRDIANITKTLFLALFVAVNKSYNIFEVQTRTESQDFRSLGFLHPDVVFIVRRL